MSYKREISKQYVNDGDPIRDLCLEGSDYPEVVTPDKLKYGIRVQLFDVGVLTYVRTRDYNPIGYKLQWEGETVFEGDDLQPPWFDFVAARNLEVCGEEVFNLLYGDNSLFSLLSFLSYDGYDDVELNELQQEFVDYWGEGLSIWVYEMRTHKEFTLPEHTWKQKSP